MAGYFKKARIAPNVLNTPNNPCMTRGKLTLSSVSRQRIAEQAGGFFIEALDISGSISLKRNNLSFSLPPYRLSPIQIRRSQIARASFWSFPARGLSRLSDCA